MDSINKKVIDFYTKEAEIYDEVRFTTYSKRYIDRIEKKIVLDMIETCENLNILEIGCGTGRFSIYLSEQGSRISALDPAMSMLFKLKEKNVKNINLINASGYELPFKNNTFNGCICLNVINHLQTYKKILIEVNRVLQPGGFFIFNFSNIFSIALPYALRINITKRSAINDVYTRWDNLPKIRDDLSHVGFFIDKMEGCFPVPGTLSENKIIPWIKKLNEYSQNSFVKYTAVTIFIKAICEKIE
ncbi:MAG: class I SAM-dependent methyltransferase [Candidatus Thermoplasmatota archaeon]|nr:class I SAM-dependent methyltransferase [Candidatus Thermoplasmatota archaeon]